MRGMGLRWDPSPGQVNDYTQAIVWSLVLIAVVIGLFVAVTGFRRWWRGEGQPLASAGFSMSDLRRMHEEGQLSDEEYDKARTITAMGLRREMDRGEKPADKGGGGGG